MDKKKLLSAFKLDFQAADTLRATQDTKIKGWKDQYDGKPYGNEQDGKSKIVSRDIKKQDEWQHASIIDPFVSSSDIVKCNPITFEDQTAARQNELLLNTQFCRQFNRFNFMTKVTKILSREGTVIVQTGWDYEEEEVETETEIISADEYGREYISGITTVTEIVIKKNQPTATVCRNEDIFLDPTCQDDMDKCQFVIYRYETDLSSLKQDGRYKNLGKIAVDSTDGTDYLSPDDTNFKFEDNPRKKLLVHEYWGNYDVNEDGIAEPIVCAWVNDTIIRLQSNPYPDQKPPFVVASFNSIPFELYGEANAEFIGDNQKIKTAITRGIIDNMAQSNNGQKGIKKGALDVANRKKFLANQNFEYNGSANDFWDGSYNQIPGSAFDMLAMQNNEIESMTATKSFSGGISGNSLGATATGARGALDATSTRRLNIVRNIAENVVKPLLRKWMSYNGEFLNETEVIRITNEEFVEIKRDDLEGRIDIGIEVSTSEDNAAKSQELSFLLQTVGPSEDPAVRRMLMADILELMKMPDKAKKLREYQPQPDPIQQQMQQLELQLLQAKVFNEQMKGEENKVDSQLKLSRANLDASKAALISSQKDMQDLEFLKKDSGTDEQNAIERLKLTYQNELDKLVIKHESDLMKIREKTSGDLAKQDLITVNKIKEKFNLI